MLSSSLPPVATGYVVPGDPRSQGAELLRRRRCISNSTAATMMAPLTICWVKGETPTRLRMLASTAKIAAPMHGADDAALAAEQAGAADDGDGDRFELEADAGDRLADGQPRHEDQRGQRREHAADHIDREDREADIDAGQPRRFRDCCRRHRCCGRRRCSAARHRPRSRPRRRSRPAPAGRGDSPGRARRSRPTRPRGNGSDGRRRWSWRGRGPSPSCRAS